MKLWIKVSLLLIFSINKKCCDYLGYKIEISSIKNKGSKVIKTISKFNL